MLTVQRGVGDKDICMFRGRQRWSVAGLVGTTLLIILGGLLVALSWHEYQLNPYYSSEFTDTNNFTQSIVTDRDIKMAFTFYDNQTGGTINSSQLINIFKSTVYFFDQQTNLYYEQSLLICSPDYFGAQNVQLETCVSLPHRIQYSLNYTQNFADLDTIYFGVAFTSAFTKPFLAQGQDWKNVYEWSYFICYFTSAVLDNAGHRKLQPHRINSLNYDSQIFQPTRSIGLYVNLWVAVIHQSIFFFQQPQSYSGLEWVGNQASYDLQNIPNLNYEGIGVNLITSTNTIYQYRYYAQINAIIASIVGLLYICYLLFRTVLSLPSRANSHNYTVKEIMVPNETVEITCWEIFKADLTKKSKGHEKGYREITDLISILKKSKVTLRNIQAHLKLPPFQVSKLYLQDDHHDPQPDVSIQCGQEKEQLENIHQLSVVTAINPTEQVDQTDSQDKPSWFTQFDIFGVPVAFTSSEGCSMCRILGAFLVFTLTWLFCSSALGQMKTTRYEYSEIGKSSMIYSFDVETDFNLAICVDGVDKNHLIGQDPKVKVQFYASENNQQRIIPAIQALNSNLKVPQQLLSSICFIPNTTSNIELGFSGFGQQSYFGFRIDVLNNSRDKFNEVMTTMLIYIVYINNQFSVSKNNFAQQTVKQSVNLNSIFWDQFAYQEQAFLDVTQVQYQDGSIHKRLFFNKHSGVLQSRTIQGQHYYNLQLRLSGALTSYKLHYQYSNYELLGLLGGILIFWTFIIGRWAKPYLNLKSNLRLAGFLFDQSIIGNSGKCIMKYFWWVPVAFWPTACWRNVSKLNDKIEEELDIVKIIKENNKVYEASTELFDTAEKREIAHYYIKDLQDYTLNETKQDLEGVSVESWFKKSNKVMPVNQKDNTKIYSSEELIQDTKERIGVDRPVSRIEDLDLFSSPSRLNLKGAPVTKSYCGAISSFIFLSIVVVISSKYLTSGCNEVKIGMDNYIEDIIEDDSGLNLTVNSNFQFIISFRTITQDLPKNVSDFFTNKTVQMGVEIIQVIRNGTHLTENITRIDLVPCFLSDFKQWIGPRINQTFFKGDHFCIPSGLKLRISNFHDGLQKQYFKLVINQINDSIDNNFIRSYLPVLHISTPTCDPLSKNISYGLQRMFIDFVSMQGAYHNFSFTKIRLNNKVDTPFSLEAYSVLRADSVESSYDLSDTSYRIEFSKSSRVRSSTASQKSYWSIIGLLGGMWYILYAVAFLFVSSFDKYLQKYIIARDLYPIKKVSEPKLLLSWIFSFFKSDIISQLSSNLIDKVSKDLQINNFLRKIRQYNLALRCAPKNKEKYAPKKVISYQMLNEAQVRKKATGYGLQIDEIFAEKKEKSSQMSICEN